MYLILKLELNNKSIIEIPADRQPIGNHFKKALFTNHTFQVKTGSRIFLFSDGYADQFGGERNKKLTKVRFKKLLLENFDNSMRNHVKILSDQMKSWSEGFEQVDDILVLGIEL